MEQQQLANSNIHNKSSSYLPPIQSSSIHELTVYNGLIIVYYRIMELSGSGRGSEPFQLGASGPPLGIGAGLETTGRSRPGWEMAGRGRSEPGLGRGASQGGGGGSRPARRWPKAE